MKKYVHDRHKTLLLRSEETKKYPKLMEALMFNEDITDKNIGQFSEETQNLIKHSLKRILEVARNEWVQDPLYQVDESQETRCSLCGRPNKYVYHIHNSENGDTMNVGSECIGYFVPGSQKGVFIRTAKRNARIIELNNIYPGIERTIKHWSRKTSEYDIIIPNYIASSYHKIGGQLEKYFRDYSDGRIKETEIIKKIKELFSIGKDIEQRMVSYVNENMGKRFVATRKMEIYLANNQNNTTLARIKEIGYVTIDTAGYIAEPEFMDFIYKELSQRINESTISNIRPVPGEKLYVFSVTPYKYIDLAVLHLKLMESIGSYFFNGDVIPNIDDKLLDSAQPYNKKSYEDILDVIIKLLQRMDIQYDGANFEFDEIIFRIRNRNQYILVPYKKFIEHCLKLIYQDRPHKEVIRLIHEYESDSIFTKGDIYRRKRMWSGEWEKEEAQKYRNRR
jgi:hypothetical protein